ncbi:MAG: CDP-alcohol phosphatidyltransferase family protein, partial [Candidatus Aminicenantales bacterium]
MSTPSHLVLEFLQSLKRPDVEELADLWIFRPLAFLLVKAVYRTSLTPNQLSEISMALGIGAGIVFATAGPAGVWAGAALLFVAVVVDCADGQLARLKHTGTHMGRVIDGAVDYVVGVAVYLGLGLGFLPVALPGLKGWLVLAAAGASNAIHSAVFDYYRIRYLAYVHGVSSAQIEDRNAFRREYVELGRLGGQEFRRRFIRIYLAYTAFQRKVSREPMTMGRI